MLSCLACLTPGSADAENAGGIWRGEMTTQNGNVEVVVRIFTALRGFVGLIEIPDDPLAERMPVVVGQSSPELLELDAPSIKGSFAGAWSATDQAWFGSWSQSGNRIPLVLHRQAMKPIEGLDGDWEAQAEHDGRTSRLVVHILTIGESTTLTFDEPDAGVKNLVGTEFSRDGDDVRFVVSAAGAQFNGTFTSGDRLTGLWSSPGRPPTDVIFIRQSAFQWLRRPRAEILAVPHFRKAFLAISAPAVAKSIQWIY